MLTVFFVVPFGIMLAVSFFRRVQGAFYEPDFVFDNYARFLTLFFAERLGFSLFLAALVAAICVAVGLPFTYQLTKLSRRLQVLWLVGLLAILSLSEVIIGFAWSTLFSRTAGITNLFVALGLMDEAVSLSPSFGAVLTGMVYQAFPYTVLVLYPSVVAARSVAGGSGAHARRLADPRLLQPRRAGAAERAARHAHHGVRLRARLLSAAAASRPAAALDALGADHRPGDLPVEHAVRRRDGGLPCARQPRRWSGCRYDRPPGDVA